jgi:hypothetical protein
MSKIEDLKELNEMLKDRLVTQAEFERLRSDLFGEARRPPPLLGTSGIGDTGRPFSIPVAPRTDLTVFRHPATGRIVEVEKWPTFWLTFFFGCFYLAYKELWVHAAILFGLALTTSGLAWFCYAPFAYRIVVDAHRRRGWIDVTYDDAGREPIANAL